MTEQPVKEAVAGVFGGAGFTGGEVCRLLLGHPGVTAILPTSRGDEDFERLHRNLAGCGLELTIPEALLARADELDVAFLCTPSGEAMRLVPDLLEAGVRVVDLSADFRFPDPEEYRQAYGAEHACPDYLAEAVCGITELHREEVAAARLVANPGCYVIASTLALAPLLQEDLIALESPIQIAAVNGTSGAGSSPRPEVMHANAFGTVLPYSMEGHRHGAELEARFREIAGRPVVASLATAHGNFARGIYVNAGLAASPAWDEPPSRETLADLYLDFYGRGHGGEHFVLVNDLPRRGELNAKEYDLYPQVGSVTGSNFCHLGLDFDPDRGLIKAMAAIDNLVKGAAGSAIQNMNLMLGFEETAGLAHYGI
ncbi:MAG TPA: N-acetyl-gamma-glutamyl-phosphate reductase [Solirubrobacterales bacterium]|nr:N-acetyl-gamma-glutamyl-phosphate reductase [Solirubrobacterales bacterium]